MEKEIKENDNKKKFSIKKIILLVVLIVLIILIAITTRKVIIIKNLQAKIKQYDDATNYSYVVKNEGDDSSLDYYAVFYKDGVSKSVMKPKIDGAQLIQFEYQDVSKTFVDAVEGGENTLIITAKDEETTTNTAIPFSINYLDKENNFFELIRFAFLSKIESKELNGVKYYVISGMNSTNYMYDANAVDMEIYVNQETGMAEKIINYFSDDSKQIVNYEMKLNVVTDEDIKEPDASNYSVSEY